MRFITPASLILLTLLAAPVHAQDEQKKPVTDQDVTAMDVVATPATDLNLKKDEIPALLISAQESPYTLRGVGNCARIGAAVAELDGVLGDDIDLPQGARKANAGRVAQSVVGAFIPFRGVIREVSGANKRDRDLQAAIMAGMARRAFLKGIGQARGCRYPARSATLDVYNRQLAALGREPVVQEAAAVDRPAKPADRRSDGGVTYESRPVVQRY